MLLGELRRPSNLFVGDYTDPDEFLRLRSEIINMKKRRLSWFFPNRVPRSEVSTGYLYFRDFMQDKLKETWRRHFLFFVTGAQEGILVKEAKRKWVNSYRDFISGRPFCPFFLHWTLKPAVIMGIDVSEVSFRALMFDHFKKFTG